MDVLRRRVAALAGCALMAATGCAAVGDPSAGASPAAAGDDWPTYAHDAAHTGFSFAERAIAASNLQRIAPAWQVDLGTSGVPTSGGPTVAGGRVFVGSSVPQGDNFFAFDAASGALAWSAALGRRSGPCAHFEDVGIPSTSAISGSVLVVGGGDGAYYGLDAGTGTILWRHDLDAGPSAFAWSSPLIAGNRVYVGVSSQCDNPPVRGELRSLDLATGSLLAQRFFTTPDAAGAGIWNSPALTGDGLTLLVTTGEDNGAHFPLEQAMVALDATTLDVLDSDRVGPAGQDLDFASSPILFRDRLDRRLVGASHKDGCFYTYELGKLSAGPTWSRCVGSVVGVVAAYDATLGDGGTLLVPGLGIDLGGPQDPQIYALDPETGADRRPSSAVHVLAGGFALANGLIFVNAGAAGLKILDERSGEILRVLLPAGAGDTFSGVALSGGRVFWLSGSRLNAWQLG